MREDLEALYFDWLCTKVLDHSNSAYLRLLTMLHKEEFVWLVGMDENRAEDGRDLRRDFFRESGIERDSEWGNVSCSILEMLIALARRAEFQTDDSVKWWFWRIIENIGLNDPFIPEVPFGDAIHTLMWRLYDYDGMHGGMFPLIKHDFGDQRKVEIWYQLCHYIEDNQMI